MLSWISGDEMNSERREPAFQVWTALIQECSCKHKHKGVEGGWGSGVGCLSISSLTGENVPMSVRDETEVDEGKSRSPTER